MTTSENGIAMIKRNEGFASTPYADGAKMAWGYGHDRQPGEIVPQSVTQDEADAILRSDLSMRFEPPVNDWLEAHGQAATQNQFDALVDFAYNDGAEALDTMLAHGWDQTPAQMLRWDYAGGTQNAGLLARRREEAALWNQA